jgi:hypothetical protein
MPEAMTPQTDVPNARRLAVSAAGTLFGEALSTHSCASGSLGEWNLSTSA